MVHQQSLTQFRIAVIGAAKPKPTGFGRYPPMMPKCVKALAMLVRPGPSY
jgi:hypothetical protein